VQANTRTWRAIRISEGSAGFDESGMVSSLSAELARQLISIYYLSTFDTDFTLVMHSLTPYYTFDYLIDGLNRLWIKK
jgi:hypothetical protein